jgi:cytochrome c-type biogenesis protein CcmE
MNRRTRRTLWIVAAVLLLLAVAIFLRSKAPPEAARLLPESDGILYVNLKPFRSFCTRT